MKGWIGIDLDGTLAHYDGWKGIEHVGEPVIPMVVRVRKMIADGEHVKIFTARVYGLSGDELTKAVQPIAKFCIDNFGHMLDVTCVKDFGMIALYDDRAYHVIPNTGTVVLPP